MERCSCAPELRRKSCRVSAACFCVELNLWGEYMCYITLSVRFELFSHIIASSLSPPHPAHLAPQSLAFVKEKGAVC